MPCQTVGKPLVALKKLRQFKRSPFHTVQSILEARGRTHGQFWSNRDNRKALKARSIDEESTIDGEVTSDLQEENCRATRYPAYRVILHVLHVNFVPDDTLELHTAFVVTVAW